jgi:hypothetical protein
LLFVMGLAALLAGSAVLTWRGAQARLRYVPPELLAPPPPAPAPAAVARAERSLDAAMDTLREARRREALTASPGKSRPERLAGGGRSAVAPTKPSTNNKPASSTPYRYRVSLREQDLNTLLRTRPEAKEFGARYGLERLTATIERDRFRVGGLLKVARLPANARFGLDPKGTYYVSVEGAPTVDSATGRLRFRSRAVRIGKQNAPAFVREQLDRRITDALSRRAAAPRKNGRNSRRQADRKEANTAGLLRLPGRVRQVRLEPGQLIISGEVP